MILIMMFIVNLTKFSVPWLSFPNRSYGTCLSVSGSVDAYGLYRTHHNSKGVSSGVEVQVLALPLSRINENCIVLTSSIK